MITVHHLENSRSQRVLWLLEELSLEYDVKRYERDKKTNLAPPELKKVHSLGKSPVIDDGGQIFAETGAMFEHIVDRHGAGRLRPAHGTPAFDKYRYWMFAAEGSYMPPMVLTLLLSRMESAPPFFIRPLARALVKGVKDAYLNHTMKALFDYLESELGKDEWLTGPSISAADIMMSFPMEAFAARGDIGAYPKIAAFVDRVQSRGPYKRALERGGPYALMR